jgi:cytochrome c biogenesis protein CcdA
VDSELIGLAFAAGLVAALNPCGFAMLPAYLALVVRGDSGGGRGDALATLSRAVAATAAMALGFLVVFGTFGLLTVAAAATVQRYLPYVTVVIGSVLVALGIWLSFGRNMAGLIPMGRTGWAPTARLGSMFGYGLSYAVASLSCTIAPFLAVTGMAFHGGSRVGGVLVYVAYAAGFTLVVGALAVAAALASSAVADRLRRILPHLNRITGALLVLVGLYVTYYGLYEVRLFNAGGDAADPVIAAAGRLQGAIVGWVHRHGAWPWAIALAVLSGVALLVAWRARARAASRYRRADRAMADGEPSPRRQVTPRRVQS